MDSNANNYSNITASAAVKTTSGILAGMYVNSTSSGTIRFNDGASGTPAAGTKATGVLTASGVFSDGETVTIGNRTYTFVDALTFSADQVLIGASAAASLDNLKAAINNDAGEGTTYSNGTAPHSQVTATTNTDTAQTVEAFSVGTYANALVSTEECDNAAFGAATLTGGVNTNVTINNTITPAVGWHNLGDVAFNNGLYATIGNTLNVTLVYK